MLRWGVIGVGGFLDGTIAPAMVAEPNCKMMAVVSREQTRADDFASRWDIPRAYTSYEDMLGDSDVDAVYIATPNSLHADQVVSAARAGKHVFCEKPLANSGGDAARAVRACEEGGVRLGVDLHNRHVPWVQDVARMVTDGTLGTVRLIEVDVGSGPRHYDNWRADAAVAGLGSVHNVGVHALDFLQVILGSEPMEVAVMFDQAPEDGSVEMLALILMRFENGTMAYLNCNESLQHPANAITIYGTEARITGTGLTRSRVGGDLSVVTRETQSIAHYPPVEAHRLCLAAFTDAILSDREPVPSGRDGLRSAQLCEAITSAVMERRVVRVDHGGGQVDSAGAP